MNKFSILGRASVFAVMLATAAVVASRPAVAETYDRWTSIVYQDGVCGVRTRMNDGGELRLEIGESGIDLVATDPSWDMTPGQTTRISIDIDGRRFNGKGNADSSTVLRVSDLTESFVDAFIVGDWMTATLGGVRWNVDLSGSALATDDMVACASHAGSGWAS